MDLKWLVVKVVVCKRCSDKWDVVIGQIGVVSYHLSSLLGALELIVLCGFQCKVGFFDAKIKETILYK